MYRKQWTKTLTTLLAWFISSLHYLKVSEVSFHSFQRKLAAISQPSTWGGGVLRRVSTSVMEQGAIVIHSCNIFDHSKDFLAFSTSPILLINVSRSKCKYTCRNSYLQLLRLIPTISIKFSKHHFLDSYWPPCWLFVLAYLIHIHAHIRRCLQSCAIMEGGPWKCFIVGIRKV